MSHFKPGRVVLQFIISSRGRPIGTTELGFQRFLGGTRSGWFHPNALGETLMPDIALLLPAMRAYVCRDVRDETGQSIVQPSFRSSSLFADIAEAFQRMAGMELTLHHADGTLIPTAQIGIQDSEQLLALATWDDLYPEADPALDDAERDESIEMMLVDDLELPLGGWEPSHDDEEDDFDLEELVKACVERAAFPRYQVHVELVNENAIP
jgi:hypothetical protein